MATGDPAASNPVDDKSAASALDYNPVFGKLVDSTSDGDPDLAGFVAYGIYKIAKREWIETFKSSNQSKKPSSEELAAYTTSWTKTQLDNVKARAQSILAEYAQSVIEDVEPQILKRALKGTFWRSIILSMLANLFYTALLILVALVLSRSGIDILGLFKNN